jgi:hypothetical protein
MQRFRPFQSMFLLVLLLALPVSFAAQTTTADALTNADIVRMMKAGISENIIVREIEISRTNFGTGPTELIELKNQGASERVLGAVLDSRSGARQAPSEPLPAGYVTARSAAAGPHHLPSFEANVRLNGNKNSKISVGQNHIKAEEAGVPLFSLKWKENGK